MDDGGSSPRSRNRHPPTDLGNYRPGGSDVSQTETTASRIDSDNYLLDGFKWFASATDSDVSPALARTGDLSQGTRSLSLFLISLNPSLYPPYHRSLTQPTRSGVLVHRLKNKFGTQIVPTAELSLQETHGKLIGALNKMRTNLCGTG